MEIWDKFDIEVTLIDGKFDMDKSERGQFDGDKSDRDKSDI